MEKRTLGRTGAQVSVMGFGCGAIGGLMVRGEPKDQERGVARALELGITYFDTAPLYGNGASETNLGRVLKALKPDIFLSTKLTIVPGDEGRIGAAVAKSLEESLTRLGRDRVDLLQLHNRIARTGTDRPLAPEVVLGEVVPALHRLRDQGKIRFLGITALGDTDALLKVAEAGAFDTAQVVYNLLNPSAKGALPKGLPGQDFAGLLGKLRAQHTGAIGIRVLAAGALSGTEARHPLGVPSPAPIASGADYAADVRHAHRFEKLVRDGHAASLVEAALRFVVSGDALDTALVGLSTLEQLEASAAAILKGPLPESALDDIAALSRDGV
jgi:aryl-alcohol dehydrogenase-like predicted oxidoreductase